ncbi:class II glutamine amidotransferase [Rickettsiales bacterium]|nr:class II glutamine amidotransferase [Rickettsiales bacterium]
MCRWIAYIGKSIYMDTLVTRPAHSLVAQSLNTKMRYKPDGSILAINGDGFGIGWYGKKDEPGLYKVSDPAWSNENIHEICSHTEASIFMAHIREATTGEVQRSNTHPFKYKNWLFQHNGRVNGFDTIRRDLEFEISSELYPQVKGNTDSEVFFFLALTYGLEKNPKSAIEKTIARIKEACKARNIPLEITLSIALSNGSKLYTARYAYGIESNSQYYSTHAECMKEINSDFAKMPPDGVVVVSEPLDYSLEHWEEMPESSFATIVNSNITIEKLSL